MRIDELPEEVSELVIQLVMAAHAAGIDRARLLNVVRDAQDTHHELETDSEWANAPKSRVMANLAEEWPVVVISCGDR